MIKNKRLFNKLEGLAKVVMSIDNYNIDKAIENYKWYSLAGGIHDEELTMKLLKQIRKENLHHKLRYDKENLRWYLDIKEV